MATSTTDVPDIGTVSIIRKRGVRSMRLRVEPNGSVRLTLPWWVQTRVGLQFLHSKAEWIREQQADSVLTLADGMQVAGNIQLRIEHSGVTRISSKWKNPELLIKLPPRTELHDPKTQEWIQTAIFKILRIRAEEQLLPRLQFLADLYDFDFRSSTVRKLKARWGSCTSKKDITLNAYLVQLTPELIDYVLIHELVHTEHLHHGPDFWKAVEAACPDFKSARKTIKRYQPRLYAAE
jgi:predicted metal-dependent hydrolase